jgi:hypothetical protein
LHACRSTLEDPLEELKKIQETINSENK